MADPLPEKLGKYKIIEEVGRGGFAAVYKAVDTTLDRTVALKVLAPHLLWDPTFVQRFQREAKVAANLDHPHIVTIYEVGQIEGVYFIAMRFLAGRTLSQILETEGPLPIARVQAIIEQLASALDYAHARGLVHRDVKPSNVMVADDGRATMTDFGLVKAGEGTKLSTTGVVFGTPEYMSPEQAEGKALDARSDVYSLGVVLFEMLAGRAPFVADTTPAVMYKHVHEPPPLEELPSDLPQGVVAVLEKALAKKREARYQSAGEMARALEEAIEAGVKVAPIPPEPEVPTPLPAVKKRAEEKVAPPLVEPVAVAKEEAKPPTAPPTPKAIPKRALGWVALLAGGLVLLCTVGTILLAIKSCQATPTPTAAPMARVTTPAPTVTPTATPIPPTDTPVPPTSTPMSPTDTPLLPTPMPTSMPMPTMDIASVQATQTAVGAPEGMVYVPAGEFIMGSSDADVDSALVLCNKYRSDCQRSWFEAEQPQHTVYLDAFYMAKTEVTNAQYAAFVQATGHAPPAGWEGGKPPGGKEDHPVANVTWYDAVAYCSWLSEVTGKPYRLPSEAEWEKGARGTDGRIWPWGNEWDAKRCNIDRGDSMPVGAYPEGASPYGLLDMAGNAWEWTQSLYKGYPYDPSDGREDLEAEGPRVLRGGSWGCPDEWYARCSFRYSVRPDFYLFGFDYGFRVMVSARSLP